MIESEKVLECIYASFLGISSRRGGRGNRTVGMIEENSKRRAGTLKASPFCCNTAQWHQPNHSEWIGPSPLARGIFF